MTNFDDKNLAALRDRLAARPDDPDAASVVPLLTELGRLRAVVALAEEQFETIERQRVALADLSAPIIDVADRVIALPIVGVIDSERSSAMTERLLERIVSTSAKWLIIDLTGVDFVDTVTAHHLLQMVRASALLGALSILSGIRPEVAQTLAELDVDLSAIVRVRNFKQAIELCLRPGAGANGMLDASRARSG